MKRNPIETVDTPDGARAVRLNPVEVDVIHLFVQLSRSLNQPPSVAEIYGLLFISPKPLPQDDFPERLNLSKGSASQGLRYLMDLGGGADGLRGGGPPGALRGGGGIAQSGQSLPAPAGAHVFRGQLVTGWIASRPRHKNCLMVNASSLFRVFGCSRAGRRMRSGCCHSFWPFWGMEEGKTENVRRQSSVTRRKQFGIRQVTLEKKFSERPRAVACLQEILKR